MGQILKLEKLTKAQNQSTWNYLSKIPICE